MNQALRPVVRFALLGVLCASTASAQIRWADSLADALTQAAADNTIVMIALSMPGERASDLLENGHYRDSRLGQLSKHSVNLVFRVGPNGEFDTDERLVRERYLGAGPDTSVAVPHHLFVKPVGDGELISSVAYQLTEGQLEWIWVDAIRTVQPTFEWELSDAARAPERMKKAGVTAGDETPEPPTEEEVEHALAEIKKSSGGGRRGGGWMRSLEHVGVIVRSDEKAAIKWATTTMRSFGSTIAQRVLRTVGEYSPQPWWTFAASYLEDRSEEAREESARALEQLAAKKSLSPLKKQLRAEKSDTVKGRLIRALAAVAPSDNGVASTIGKVLSKEKSAEVRIQAAAAISVLEKPDAVRKHLEAALEDKNDVVRSAAAFAIASRRDKELLPLLESAAARERNNEAKRWMTTAKSVVETGELEPFDDFRKNVLGDRLDRQGLDLESAWRNARGRRGGDDDGEEDDDSGDGAGADDDGRGRRGR